MPEGGPKAGGKWVLTPVELCCSRCGGQPVVKTIPREVSGGYVELTDLCASCAKEVETDA